MTDDLARLAGHRMRTLAVTVIGLHAAVVVGYVSARWRLAELRALASEPGIHRQVRGRSPAWGTPEVCCSVRASRHGDRCARPVAATRPDPIGRVMPRAGPSTGFLRWSPTETGPGPGCDRHADPYRTRFRPRRCAGRAAAGAATAAALI